jgi:hypothetical protein
MDEEMGPDATAARGRLLKAVRCVPFAAVMLCFLLPFFTVSSCSDDSEAANAYATATGVDVVLGRSIHAHATAPEDQSSTDVEAEVQPKHSRSHMPPGRGRSSR